MIDSLDTDVLILGAGGAGLTAALHATDASPVLLDPEGEASTAYHITATPTVFLIGRDGKLVAKALGTKPWTSEPGRALLSYLVKQR